MHVPTWLNHKNKTWKKDQGKKKQQRDKSIFIKFK